MHVFSYLCRAYLLSCFSHVHDIEICDGDEGLYLLILSIWHHNTNSHGNENIQLCIHSTSGLSAMFKYANYTVFETKQQRYFLLPLLLTWFWYKMMHSFLLKSNVHSMPFTFISGIIVSIWAFIKIWSHHMPVLGCCVSILSWKLDKFITPFVMGQIYCTFVWCQYFYNGASLRLQDCPKNQRVIPMSI